jgi:hypothetical protein
MAKYVFAYHGGSHPNGPEEVKKVMDAWGGKSSTVKADGSLVSGGGANPVSGYSLIEASSLDDAHKKAKGCPILKVGGTIEIAQAMDM